MKLTSCLIAATALFATQALALPANTFIYMHPSQQQQVLQAASEIIQGVFSRDNNALAPDIHTGGAFNKWCRHAKDGFLKSLDNGGANEWVIVAGNEAAGGRASLTCRNGIDPVLITWPLMRKRHRLLSFIPGHCVLAVPPHH